MGVRASGAGRVTWRDRLRRLPNSLLLYVTFGLAIGAAVLATLPFEAAATRTVPPSEIEQLRAAASTSSSTTTIPDPETVGSAGTTTTTIRVGLESQPRVEDGVVQCASPVFELSVPAVDQRTAENGDCSEGARWRLTLAIVGGAVAFLVGVTARRLRLRRYEPIVKDEKRRLLGRRGER